MLVDGEHYPTVVKAAVGELRAQGRKVVGAALVGGSEKIPAVEAGWPGPGSPGELYGVEDVVGGFDAR